MFQTVLREFNPVLFDTPILLNNEGIRTYHVRTPVPILTRKLKTYSLVSSEEGDGLKILGAVCLDVRVESAVMAWNFQSKRAEVQFHLFYP